MRLTTDEVVLLGFVLFFLDALLLDGLSVLAFVHLVVALVVAKWTPVVIDRLMFAKHGDTSQFPSSEKAPTVRGGGPERFVEKRRLCSVARWAAPHVVLVSPPAVVAVVWAIEVYCHHSSMYPITFKQIQALMIFFPFAVIFGIAASRIVRAIVSTSGAGKGDITGKRKGDITD